MNAADVLAGLLSRIAAAGGEVALFSERELNEWPAGMLVQLKSAGLLIPSTPAATVACPGCEEECAMPVEPAASSSGAWRGFIVCDKREDTARVPVPAALVVQWQCSPALLAAQLAKKLDLRRSPHDPCATRLDVGLLKGSQHSAHVELHVAGALQLHVAGHVLALADVLAWGDEGITIERRALVRCVDAPIAGAGSAESAEQRQARLRARVGELKASGVKGFLKALAAEEGLSETRIKQLLKMKPEPATPGGVWAGLLPMAKGASSKKGKTKA